MPKRTDIKKIIIIGAGPIIIGQACEFDYSGTQACRALKEEGYTVILVNSNPATIMTDPSVADKTYIEPLTPEIVTKILKKERPDALLPTVGGQTGLNLAMTLHKSGILDELGIEMIGANAAAIEKAEGRKSFKEAMAKIGLDTPISAIANTLEESKKSAKEVGYPCVIRPAFTLGGTGGGIVKNENELEEIVKEGLEKSLISEILIEESIAGWKEYELEVIRDKNDNVVIICSIENIDPMGVHTGDSITVAPAQTLTDKEYQIMRNAAIAIIREIGVDTGGSNIQFATHPETGRMIIIEMNPRVSRSSALASKATGFPIAKLAAKLAVGYTLDELQNDITKKTPACFEPTLDYVVVKIPRFNFEKFPQAEIKLGTAMKSVGEAMSIGRTFKESFQKGLRSLETNRFGFGFDGKDIESISEKELIEHLETPRPERIFYIHYALRKGMSIETIYNHSKIDPWFLRQFKEIIDQSKKISLDDPESLLKAKQAGFSDRQIAFLTQKKDETVIRAHRKKHDIKNTYYLVDTCAGEFEASTPYYYSTYETENEARLSDKKKVMILGGGPNRIGQGIEFDYCCVHASYATREEGFESIMVNSNPETVSTDFDTSDKLYFEPLTFEDVLNIYETEKPEGIIVQFGGQTPLNLAIALEKAGVTLLGTSSDSIDLTEDRKRFQALLEKISLKQPKNATVISEEEALKAANDIGYPVVVRPSYVLGGASMQIVYNDEELSTYIHNAIDVSPNHPILIDHYLTEAIEIDVDAIGDGDNCLVAGIMEHVELAGIHSGDSACVLPPYTIKQDMINIIREATIKLGKELKIKGLMNIQFAIKDQQLYVIEVNPRASRTVPFVSKTTGIPWAKMATKIMLGATISSLKLKETIPKHVAVKESVFPFNKFKNVDTLLGPEMKSTGEVMGIDTDFKSAFVKSQLATNQDIPLEGQVLVTVNDRDKRQIMPIITSLHQLGFEIIATEGTAKLIQKKGFRVTSIKKIDAGSPNPLDCIHSGKVKLVINTSTKDRVHDEKLIRRAALNQGTFLATTLRGAEALLNSIQKYKDNELNVTPLQDYI